MICVSNLIANSILDIYSLADCRETYYQQRWHSTETDEVPTVEEILKDHSGTDDLQKILSFFGIADLLPKKLIFLSSGELRKFLIVRSLLSHPRILILDNPFIGLDAASRDVLLSLLQQMAKLENVQVILLLSNPGDIPEMITHVLPVHNRKPWRTVNVRNLWRIRSCRHICFPVIRRICHYLCQTKNHPYMKLHSVWNMFL